MKENTTKMKRNRRSRTSQGTKGKDIFNPKSKNDPSVESGRMGVSNRSTNDINWYVTNQRLLDDTTNVSFNVPSGVNIPEALTRNTKGIYQALVASPGSPLAQWFYNNPGVLSVNLVPMYGMSKDSSSAINQAANQIYSFIRAENSGGKNYVAPDLMMYLLAMDSLFSLYAFMLRAYGTLSSYSFWNNYQPEAILNAMGLDLQSFQSNYAQFRADINIFAKKLSTYCVPNTMPIFNRHAQMFANVYKDSESPKAQLIMYNPSVYWKYSPATDEQGTELLPVSFRGNYNLSHTNLSSNLITYSEFWDFANKLINAVDDEDFTVMSGDILKAYGPNGIWTQEFINVDYTMEPIFDFTWLTQVQNAYALDKKFKRVDKESWNLDDDGGATQLYIKQTQPDPSLGSTYIKTGCLLINQDIPNFGHDVILASPYNTPTPADIMESTRLTIAGISMESGNGYTSEVTACGGEIVSDMEMFVYGQVGSSYGICALPLPTHLATSVKESQPIYTRLDVVKLAFSDNFAMHPTTYLVNSIEKPLILEGTFCDLDNYAVVDSNFLKRAHDVATLSLLYTRNAGMFEPRS